MWPLPPDLLVLQPEVAHVFRLILAVDGYHLGQLESLLDSGERARAARLIFDLDRYRLIAAHGQVRQILGALSGAAPDQLRFAQTDHGKPSLPDFPRLCFNLSHSRALGLLAVILDRELGVDIEAVRPEVDRAALASRYFSRSEWQALMQLPKAAQPAAFFQVWARKEAYIKGRGLGLAIGLDSFSVSAGPEAALLVRDPRAPEGEDWRLYAIDAGEGFAAALAVNGGAQAIRQWEWRVD